MGHTEFPAGFLDALDQATLNRAGKPEHGETRFRCPSGHHDDRHPSARWNRTKAVWHCDVCQHGGGALALADRLNVTKPERGGGGVDPPGHHRTTAPPPGCTLAQYADAKRLPLDFLQRLGLANMHYLGQPAVKIPYYGADGHELAAQFRIALAKTETGDRFRWRSGSKTCLYGLNRLDAPRRRGYAVIVEGASDCHTLWFHDEPALGLPGAGNWKDDRDAAHFDGIDAIYVVIEPDSGGEAVKTWLAGSRIRDRVRLVELGTHQDPSALHLDDPDTFPERWRAAVDAATSWTDHARDQAAQDAEDAWGQCADLARSPDILSVVADTLAAAGVAGEARTLKLLYLILTSRFLPRPASAAIKGPSSGGKSYTLEQVLTLFPDPAYYALSAMSERALAYGTEPLSHRFLVIYEAAGLAGDFASYLMRSLLSEGRVRYETVEKTKDGLTPRLIEREGPTGLLVTTTAVRLHPENETRLLSIPVTDTREQTRDILRALARDAGPALDRPPWHALQTWLAGVEHRVVVPYANALANAVPPLAVRLRRDFGLILTLVRAHALLHQATRPRDAEHRIVATLADYGAVRALVADLVAEGVGATVPPSVRETVMAVRAIIAPATNATGGESLLGKVREDRERTISIAELTTPLKLDKSAVSRRVRSAIELGHLRNLEDKRGRPAKIALGEPLPDDVTILPTVAALEQCCSGAGETDGVSAPPPPAACAAEMEAVDQDDPATEADVFWTRERIHDDHGEPACFDCGGPAPADGQHWCLACRGAA